MGLEPLELEISIFSLETRPARSICIMFVITSLLDFFRFPGKKTQDNNIESKSVTAAKRARKETTVDEILGKSFIK